MDIVVVRGQGESHARLRSPRALAQQKATLDNITGHLLEEQWTASTPMNLERRVQPRDSICRIPAFDLTDFDAYEKLCGIRKLAYATSVGCPYACNYCTDMVVYKRRFNAFTAERVVDELPDLVPENATSTEEVALLDSNFPVDITSGARDRARHCLETPVSNSDGLSRPPPIFCAE